MRQNDILTLIDILSYLWLFIISINGFKELQGLNKTLRQQSRLFGKELHTLKILGSPTYHR